MSSTEQEPIDLPHLADELLEEIFLRIASPADLARASTACVTFRRVVTDRSFLRRYRSFHKPPLLGFLNKDFFPAEPPHPSAPAAQALTQAADFNFSFFPSPGPWVPHDCRDDRVLLNRQPVRVVFSDEDDDDEEEEDELISVDYRNVVADLAVCDPISRRYIILPPIPDDLITPGEQEPLLVFESFLAPAAKEEMADTSFRVVARAHYESKAVVFVFSSRTEEWRSFEFICWSVLAADASSWTPVQTRFWMPPRYYAHGCVYWVVNSLNKLLMLDTCKMVFSTVNLQKDKYIAILEAEEDMVGVFSLKRDLTGRTHLCYTTRRIKADDANGPQLNLDKTIPLPLPLDYHFGIIEAAQGYLLFQGWRPDWFGCSSEEDRPDILYFSLDPETLLLEKVCGMKRPIISAKLYTGFPPPLSTATM